jgi:hypothetical protein
VNDEAIMGYGDLFAPLFRNTETSATWSLNDLWRQVQEVTDPFVDIEKGQPASRQDGVLPLSRQRDG